MCLGVTMGVGIAFAALELTRHAQDAAEYRLAKQAGIAVLDFSSSLPQASSGRANVARSMMQVGSACSWMQHVQSVVCCKYHSYICYTGVGFGLLLCWH